MPTNNTNHTPITGAEFAQLAQSFARFQFIRNATIKQANDDAELRGLTEFMAQFFIDHAAEFLGCWQVLRSEYEPLIGVLSVLARRAIATNDSRSQVEAPQPAAPEHPHPDNVSLLITK
jgi:hypothetical protein